MLKKQDRLSKTEFDTYFASGKRFHFAHLTIIFSPFPSLRGTVVVGKKVSKSAIRRNTLRRRIYARLRLLGAEKDLKGVFIIITKPSYNSLSRVAADEFFTESIVAVQEKT